MTLSDYTFTLSKPITAGKHTIKIENTASHSHKVQVAKLAPGKKANDFPAFAEKPAGPPPGKPLGGIPAVAPRSTGYFTADFTPGDYALSCFLPDAKDGKPHFTHGMLQQVHLE